MAAGAAPAWRARFRAAEGRLPARSRPGGHGALDRSRPPSPVPGKPGPEPPSPAPPRPSPGTTAHVRREDAARPQSQSGAAPAPGPEPRIVNPFPWQRPPPTHCELLGSRRGSERALKFPRAEAGLVDDCERGRRATVSGKKVRMRGWGWGGCNPARINLRKLVPEF